jgi:hypothetical protein
MRVPLIATRGRYARAISQCERHIPKTPFSRLNLQIADDTRRQRDGKSNDSALRRQVVAVGRVDYGAPLAAEPSDTPPLNTR